MPLDKPKITVLTSSASPTVRGAADRSARLIEKGIPLDQLRKNFKTFLEGLEHIFLEIKKDDSPGEFELDEVSFTTEIGAEGEFKLVGTGVGVSANTGVTFTLRRKKAN